MSLSNETMNLFLAPWNIEQNMDVFELYNCKDLCSFACTDEKNAHRFVRLPELYDALMYAVKDKCSNCGFSVATSPVDFCKDCKYKEFSELLEDVRKGK